MKKMIWIFLMLMSTAAFAQENNTWTPEQQEQFRKQMDDFKNQMEQQMESLRDSLNQMQQQLQGVDWYTFDSGDFEMPEMPEMSEMPEIPEMPEMPELYSIEGFPPNVELNTLDDSTSMRLGKWNIVVDENYDGEDHVRVYKNHEYEDCEDGDEMKNVVTKFMQLDLGVNNYFGKGFASVPNEFSEFDPNPGKSWVVNIHAVDQRLNLIDHHLWLAYGIFFELNSYKYNTDEVLIPRIDSIDFAPAPGDADLKKNKLSCEYVGIPLMLRFESNPSSFDRSFHLSAGGFGEYLLGARTKTKTDSGDKNKVHDDFNLNRFRYGIAARAGYGWVNVFANIGLSELLQDNAGPILYPFSAGLAFEF